MIEPLLHILPVTQQKVWPQLIFVPRNFVLYGGTAIALRIGHRESVDFDFFTEQPLNDDGKNRLFTEVPCLRHCQVIDTALNTLSVSVDIDGSPVKLSFFGNIRTGCVTAPDMTNDRVIFIASLNDLLTHKLKVIHDRAQGKDYQDIATLLLNGMCLDRGLSNLEALFGSRVPSITTLKALSFFGDISEPWRLTDVMKEAIVQAVKNAQLEPQSSNRLSASLTADISEIDIRKVFARLSRLDAQALRQLWDSFSWIEVAARLASEDTADPDYELSAKLARNIDKLNSEDKRLPENDIVDYKPRTP